MMSTYKPFEKICITTKMAVGGVARDRNVFISTKKTMKGCNEHFSMRYNSVHKEMQDSIIRCGCTIE